MSMFKIFDISGSGLSAQSLRLNSVASNLANANVAAGSPEEVYQAKVPVFQSVLNGFNGEEGASVAVDRMATVAREPIVEYSPGHPKANAEGYIYKPDIGIAETMADMMSASRSYQMNVEVMNTSKRLMMRTLQLGQN